ncbi:unnamed protein product [Prunus armeniaca]|uniref:Pectate lyase domain-containing protein n=1 Tax=Prunus armeniaca TaxID=36596 RepID=A0A6J5WEB5_PRUAR|nr:unnamed protein product [Prunus armeniaca]
MACHGCPNGNANVWRFVLCLLIAIAGFAPNPSFAKKTKVDGLKLNVIDGCWRWNSDWRSNRQELALCSVGFSGKMSNNIGRDVIYYQVTDPSDNALDPKPGTLRYGVTMIKGKKWITFQREMHIRLDKPLLISSFTAIDGRGANVHIAGNACLLVFQAYFQQHEIIHETTCPQTPQQMVLLNERIDIFLKSPKHF